MRCDEVRSQLLEAIDESAAPAGLAEHLASCPACREHREMLRRHKGLFEKVESPKAPDALWQRIETSVAAPRTIRLRPVWWTAAAAAVVVAAVGLSMFMHSRVTEPGAKGPETMVATAVEAESVDSLVAQHNVLRNSNILNRALVAESEQNGYVMLAGGLR